MKIKNLLSLSAAMMLFIGCVGEDIPYIPEDETKGGVKYAGIRSSYYGFDGFPTPDEAATVMKNIAKKFDGATPSAVWIVGGIFCEDCHLEFPVYEDYPYIRGQEFDKHEPYLSKFDSIGAEVFLQVEAGMADMKTLIDLVMNRYKHHKSVVGFGIDVEWYPSNGVTNGTGIKSEGKPWDCKPKGTPGLETPLTAEKLEELDRHIKSIYPKYRIFVKHWETKYCGNKPVSDVIYIDDSQGSSKNTIMRNFEIWAKTFYPNDVSFQIGYNSDSTWWSLWDDPIADWTKEINNFMPKDQNVYIYWVDFTIRGSKFDDLWK